MPWAADPFLRVSHHPVRAGNETALSHQIHIDKELPIFALTEPAQTSPVWVMGPGDIRELTTDMTSAAALVGISLDGGQTY